MTNHAPIKHRIPVGTRVQWKARYDSDPINEGVVVAFVAKGEVFPGRPAWDINIMADIYLVDVDRTHTGRPRKTVKRMHPYAVRLESQNESALRPSK